MKKLRSFLSDVLISMQFLKGRVQGTRRVHKITISGIPLTIGDGIHSKAAVIVAKELQHDCYFLNDISFSTGDAVIDIGAHVGILSCYLAKKHPSIAIFAFEPNPENYQNLLYNIGQNGVTNVQPFNKAISGDGRPLKMIFHEGNTGGTTAQLMNISLPGHSAFDIPSQTLDSAFDELGIKKCKLLKIDCEGSEHEILQNSGFLNRIEHLRGEFHINKLLESKGYSIDRLIAFCSRFVSPENIKVDKCKMAE